MNRLIGMVVRTDGPQVTVRDGEGREWRCVLRGRLRQELSGRTTPVAVGDRVEVDVIGPLEGAVRTVLPRHAQLIRRAPRDKWAPEQILAANLDVAVIVVACPPRPTVIDRFLAIAARGAAGVAICANKVDLAEPARVGATLEPYRLAAIPVVITSALTGAGVEDLRKLIDGRLAAFLGPSGAGKSSLINALDSRLHLRVSGLARSGRGSHTTNWSAVFQVGGALVVDTPGRREVAFIGDEGGEAAGDLFPEIAALAGGCHFRDCSHTHEPKCAVKEALEAGELNPVMYRRFTRLARSGRI